MAHYGKEIGLLWTLLVSFVLINAADERGRRLFLDQRVNLFTYSNNHLGGAIIGSSGSSSMSIQSNIGSNIDINNGNILLHGNVPLDGHSLGCEHYAEYKDLVHLENELQCHSVDTVFAKLRALHERSPFDGPKCMHDVIGKLQSYFFTHHENFKGCKCTGRVSYHPERDLNVVYAELFRNDSIHGHCIPHNKVLSHLGFLPTHLDFYLDCQWEIIHHYSTIIDATGCSCFYEARNALTTPNHIDSASTTKSLTTSENKPTTDNTPPPQTHSTSTTMSLTPALTISASVCFTPSASNIKHNKFMQMFHKRRPGVLAVAKVGVFTIRKHFPYTCMKASTIRILGYGIKQANNAAGNCHTETNDHMAPDALVINMCNVTDHSESWTRGQNVMSVCERIPLYTPVATFFDGKYSNQGGLSGIFIGCLIDGFKLIVQECDKNITVMHVVTGGHFQLDPVNYSIIM